MIPEKQFSFFSDEFVTYFKNLVREVLTEFRSQQNASYNSFTGEPKKVYSRTQVAELLNRSENTITKYIRQRKLHATKINGIFYISETSLLNFINGTKK
jgi:DNA-binding NarL/FixJ family response regulator